MDQLRHRPRRRRALLGLQSRAGLWLVATEYAGADFARVDGPFAQIEADQGTFYGRTRDGRLAVWGYYNCCGLQTLGEVSLPVRAINVAGGGYGYCIIAETGALYCDLYNEGKPGLKAYPAASVP